MVQNGNQHLQDVATLQHVIQKLLIIVAQLPEEHQQLLVAVQTFRRIGQIALHQWIVEQPCDALQDEMEILVTMHTGQIVDEKIVGHAGLFEGLLVFGRCAVQRQIVIERDDENLKADLDEWFHGVGKNEMIVGDAWKRKISHTL